MLLTVFKSWGWLVILTFSLAIGYEQGLGKIRIEYMKLYAYSLELTVAKEAAEARQIKLNAQINSQSDPAWVELTLMRVLGLVPEGYKKVVFKQDDL